MAKTKEQEKRELAGVFLIGVGTGILIGVFIIIMLWGQ